MHGFINDHLPTPANITKSYELHQNIRLQSCAKFLLCLFIRYSGAFYKQYYLMLFSLLNLSHLLANCIFIILARMRDSSIWFPDSNIKHTEILQIKDANHFLALLSSCYVKIYVGKCMKAHVVYYSFVYIH